MKHTAESYLAELEARLTPLPDVTRKEIVREYRSHFAAAAEEGVSERESLRALKSPIRLSDSILRTHGVFIQAEKWQVRWLAFYCLVVVILLSYALKVTMGPIALQAIPMYFFMGTLWGFGCLPYYISCLRARRVLWKPFLSATIFIAFALWSGFALRMKEVERSLASPFVSLQLSRATPLQIQELSDSVFKIAGYSPSSGMGHFPWMYEDLRDKLSRNAFLVSNVPIGRGFLVPDSNPDNLAPVKFSVTSDGRLAARNWNQNKDRLKDFAMSARAISALKREGRWPIPIVQPSYAPRLLNYTAYIVLPLAFFAVLSSAYRPFVRRRRGVFA